MAIRKKNEHKMATRRGFLDLPEAQPEKVFIKTLEEDVFFKKMSAQDDDSYNWSMLEIKTDEKTKKTEVKRVMDNTMCKFLVRVLCDENGQRLFEDDEHALLGRKEPAVIRELHAAAMKIAEVSPEILDELEKNLSSGAIEDLPSD